MKIKKLVLENIGPYKGHHEVDFDSLTSPLFIITGPTGAGKSYIFDCICYSLYGKTSGDNRKPDGFKSSYASPSDLAFVELTFEYQGKVYKVRREPKQIMQKKKADGSLKEAREVPAKACLTKPNNVLIEKDVDSEIRDIVGLSYDEFKMTMMIAQGDFYSLINADTKNRQNILRKILKTERLSNFTESLAEKMKEYDTDFTAKKASIKSIRDSFEFDNELDAIVKNENELLSTIIPLIKDELKQEKEAEENLKSSYDEAQKDFQSIALEYSNALTNNQNYDIYINEKSNNDSLNSEKDTIKEKKERIAKAKDAKEVLKENKTNKENENKCNELKTTIEELSGKLLDAQKSKEEKEKEKETIKTLEKESDKIKVKVDEINNKINSLDEYQNDVDSFNKYQQDIDEKKQQITEKEEDLKKLDDILKEKPVDGDIARVEIELNNLIDVIKGLKGKEKTIDSYLKEDEVYKGLINDFDIKKEEVRDSTSRANDYEVLYHKSIAGILAKDLVEGAPCPVCGAIHHEKLASLDEEISKEELDRLKEEANKKSSELKDLELKLSTSSSKITNYLDNIKEFIRSDFSVNNVKELYASLVDSKNKEKEEKEDTLKALKEKKKKQSDAKEKRETLVEEKDALDKEVRNLSDEAATLKGKINAKSDLAGLDKEKLASEKEDLNKKLEDNANKISSINNEYNQASQNVVAYEASIEANKKNLERAKSDLEKSKQALDSVLKKTGISSVAEAESFDVKEDELEQLEEEVESFNDKLKASNVLLKNYQKQGFDKIIKKDIDALLKQKEESEARLETLKEDYFRINSRYSNNNRCYKDLVRENTELEKARDKYNQIKDMYDVAAGKVTGNRINFEVFYQKQVFDSVIEVASNKLYQMSDSRYQLKEGKSRGGNGQIGLEIDVDDFHTGKQREVSGLSGGESFQASMALALAFSEVIQTRAGGIELNSMFIDEGFGTLDPTMLKTTEQTLLGIGNVTNRVVGVISHIKELEDSIPSKIIIDKTRNGSSIKIING